MRDVLVLSGLVVLVVQVKLSDLPLYTIVYLIMILCRVVMFIILYHCTLYMPRRVSRTCYFRNPR